MLAESSLAAAPSHSWRSVARSIAVGSRVSIAPGTARFRAGWKCRAQSGRSSAWKRPSSSGDWRAQTLNRIRNLIHEADPGIVEERKWAKPSNPAGVPTWSKDGIITTGETYKDKVKLTFAYGASLSDPNRLFNSSLEGNTRRAIDFREGDTIDESALKALIREAVARNRSNKR